MDMLQIGIMGVAGTLLAVQFKSGKTEYGIYITVTLSLIIFISVLGRLGTIVEAMKGIGRFIRLDQAYIGTLIKMLGITYVAEFSAGICKDAGYAGIAGQVETMGKMYILLIGMSVLMTLMDSIQALAG